MLLGFFGFCLVGFSFGLGVFVFFVCGVIVAWLFFFCWWCCFVFGSLLFGFWLLWLVCCGWVLGLDFFVRCGRCCLWLFVFDLASFGWLWSGFGWVCFLRFVALVDSVVRGGGLFGWFFVVCFGVWGFLVLFLFVFLVVLFELVDGVCCVRVFGGFV